MAVRACWPVLRFSADTADATAMSRYLVLRSQRHRAQPIAAVMMRIAVEVGHGIAFAWPNRNCTIFRSVREKQSMPIQTSIFAGRTLTLGAALMLASALPVKAQQ